MNRRLWAKSFHFAAFPAAIGKSTFPAFPLFHTPIYIGVQVEKVTVGISGDRGEGDSLSRLPWVRDNITIGLRGSS